MYCIDSLIKYKGSLSNGFISIGNIYIHFGVYASEKPGPVVININSPIFKNVFYSDCKSDYYITYPENKPSIDYYGGTTARIYIPSNLPIGNRIYYMLIGAV